MNKWMEEQYEALGISREVYEFGEKFEESLKNDLTVDRCYGRIQPVKSHQSDAGQPCECRVLLICHQDTATTTSDVTH